eukprot:m.117425 g.117425  ORF g.117425 m.117425 type:complete len:103 (-) comp10942_c12_seq3:1656-1964(-)
MTICANVKRSRGTSIMAAPESGAARRPEGAAVSAVSVAAAAVVVVVGYRLHQPPSTLAAATVGVEVVGETSVCITRAHSVTAPLREANAMLPLSLHPPTATI